MLHVPSDSTPSWDKTEVVKNQNPFWMPQADFLHAIILHKNRLKEKIFSLSLSNVLVANSAGRSLGRQWDYISLRDHKTTSITGHKNVGISRPWKNVKSPHTPHCVGWYLWYIHSHSNDRASASKESKQVSRIKHQSIKAYKNPNQQSPQKAGIIMWTPLVMTYKPVKQILARVGNSDGLDLLQLKRRQHSNFSTLRNCCPKTLFCVPLPWFSEVEQYGSTGLGNRSAHTCTFIALGFFTLWKKIFGTCCPGNRRSSMSLEVNAGLVTADHQPTAELRIWGGGRVQQNKILCREGNEEESKKHFWAIKEEGQPYVGKVVL